MEDKKYDDRSVRTIPPDDYFKLRVKYHLQEFEDKYETLRQHMFKYNFNTRTGYKKIAKKLKTKRHREYNKEEIEMAQKWMSARNTYYYYSNRNVNRTQRRRDKKAEEKNPVPPVAP